MVRIDAEAQASSSDLYKAWVDGSSRTAPEVFSSVHIWGVTNPAEILQGQTPIMHEFGPYVARRIEYKRNVVFGRQPGTDLALVTYETRATWGKIVSGNTDEAITTWSPLFMALGNGPLGAAYLANPLVANWTDMARLFTTKTAEELLRGFSEPILVGLRTMVPFLPALWPGPWTNQTSWTRVTQFVGEPDRDPWNRRARVPVAMVDTQLDGSSSPRWGNRHGDANIMRGTDGMVFARPLSAAPAPLYVWSDEVGRALELVSGAAAGGISNVELDGVRLRRYVPNPRWLWNATEHAANADFNQFGPRGLANLTAMLGAEVFASKPHFLDADARLRERVQGLAPDQTVHDTFLDIEPLTGATMRAQKALQVVYRLKRMNVSAGGSTAYQVWFPQFADTSRFVPAYWVAETAQAKPSDTATFKAGLAQIAVIHVLFVVAVSFGVGITVAAGFAIVYVLVSRGPPSSSVRFRVTEVAPKGEHKRNTSEVEQAVISP